LSKCLEPIKLPSEKALRLFNKLSDKLITANGAKRVITFRSFAIGCVENGIFSQQSQNAFLNVKDKSECLSQLNSMNPKEWIKIIQERLKLSGEKAKYYHDFWMIPIEKSLNTDYSNMAHILLIKLKLLNAESYRLLQEYFS